MKKKARAKQVEQQRRKAKGAKAAKAAKADDRAGARRTAADSEERLSSAAPSPPVGKPGDV